LKDIDSPLDGKKSKHYRRMGSELIKVFDLESEGEGIKVANALTGPLSIWFETEQKIATNLHMRYSEDRSMKLVTTVVMSDLVSDVTSFVNQFHGWVSEVISTWKKWNGGYEPFGPDGKMWVQFLNWWREPFGYSESVWEKYDEKRKKDLTIEN